MSRHIGFSGTIAWRLGSLRKILSWESASRTPAGFGPSRPSRPASRSGAGLRAHQRILRCRRNRGLLRSKSWVGWVICGANLIQRDTRLPHVMGKSRRSLETKTGTCVPVFWFYIGSFVGPQVITITSKCAQRFCSQCPKFDFGRSLYHSKVITPTSYHRLTYTYIGNIIHI
jgi:hypothetical protein